MAKKNLVNWSDCMPLSAAINGTLSSPWIRSTG